MRYASKDGQMDDRTEGRKPTHKWILIYDKGQPLVKVSRMMILIDGAAQLNIHMETNVF